jgi:transcriptional regulator with XRE-family HTH domain
VDRIHARIRANIQALARRRGRSLNQVADFAGVSRSQLHNFLRGRSDVTIGWLEQVADSLDVDVLDLTVPVEADDG